MALAVVAGACGEPEDLVSGSIDADTSVTGSDEGDPPTSDPPSDPASYQDACTAGVRKDGRIVRRDRISDPVSMELFLYGLDWVTVESLEQVRFDEIEDHAIAQLVGTGSDGAQFEAEVVVDEMVDVVVRSALAEESKITIAVSQSLNGDSFAKIAIVERDGPTLIAGNCVRRIVLNPLERAIGADRTNEIIADLPELYSSGRLDELLATRPPPEPEPDPVAILNSDDVDQALRDSLGRVLLVLTIDETVSSDMLICVRATSGWNDCWQTNDPQLTGDGAVMDLFINDDGFLEVWLMKSDVDLKVPDGFIDQIRLDPTELQESELMVIRAEVSAATGQHGTLAIEATSDIDDINQDDPTWAALGDPKDARQVEAT